MKFDFLVLESMEEPYSVVDTNNRGLGIRAKKSFDAGEVIGIAMNVTGAGESDFERTDLGKFVNHSDKPNSEYARIGGEVKLIATSSITKGEEILAPYEPAMANIGYMKIEVPGDQESMKGMIDKGVAEINVPDSSKIKNFAVYLTQWGQKVRAFITGEDKITLLGYQRPQSDIDEYETNKGNQWRAKTGLELIVPDESFEENEKRAHNWELMPAEAQKESDSECIRLYGKKNMELYMDMKAKLLKTALDEVATRDGLPTSEAICEAAGPITYYELRNYILYLLRKVRKNSTKEVLQDIYDALAHYEVTGAPYVKIATLRTPSPPVFK